MRTMRELIKEDTAVAGYIEAAEKNVRAAQALVRDFEEDRQNIRRKMLKMIPSHGRRRVLIKMDGTQVAVVTDDASNNQGYAVEIEIAEVL